jgi:hypothetical protein
VSGLGDCPRRQSPALDPADQRVTPPIMANSTKNEHAAATRVLQTGCGRSDMVPPLG